MKIRQSAIYAIAALLALLGGAGGFFAGSKARPEEAGPPIQAVQISADRAQTVEQAAAQRIHESPQPEQSAPSPEPEPKPEPVFRPELPAAGIKSGYTLSFSNSGYTVKRLGRTMANIPADKAPPESEARALADGLEFETLEEIERYLEAYES